jgi:PBP1b-binding outer membrane lipoprotein LpoB
MQLSSRSCVSSARPTARAPLACALVAALSLAGCSLFGNTSSTAETATLDAVSPSTETATATLTDTGNGTTQVAITTAGGTDTGVQSAVMRSGTCGSSGDVFAVLNNVQARASITTLTDDLASLTGGKYCIEIHSSTDVNTVVACGEIP